MWNIDQNSLVCRCWPCGASYTYVQLPHIRVKLRRQIISYTNLKNALLNLISMFTNPHRCFHTENKHMLFLQSRSVMWRKAEPCQEKPRLSGLRSGANRISLNSYSKVMSGSRKFCQSQRFFFFSFFFLFFC